MMAIIAVGSAQFGGGLLNLNLFGSDRKSRDMPKSGLLGVNIGNAVRNPSNNRASLVNVNALGNTKTLSPSASSSSLLGVNVGNAVGVNVLPTYRRQLSRNTAINTFADVAAVTDATTDETPVRKPCRKWRPFWRRKPHGHRRYGNRYGNRHSNGNFGNRRYFKGGRWGPGRGYFASRGNGRSYNSDRRGPRRFSRRG